VVSLTQAAVREMGQFPYLKARKPPMTVIPTCADLSRFRPLSHTLNEPTQGETFTLGYVGSAGTWYLFDEVLACFKRLQTLRPEAKLLIVNRGEHEYILRCLHKAGVASTSVELTTATHDQIPVLMARMDAGVFFIKPVFSKQASAPTKLAEFLGCGIPCIGNAGVGDMAEVLEGERVGVALKAFDPQTLDAGLQKLFALLQSPDIQARCVDAAQRHFSLTQGVYHYRQIYADFDAQRA
jgi:glycosyltransferase involved in cell wall biosynthesis